MEYIENAKKEIREVWFKEHTILETKGEQGFQKFVWGKPGTNAYRVNYILSGFMVFISGDLGVAAYSLTELADIQKIANYDLSYFTGKLSASQHEKFDFDYKQAQSRIDEYFLNWCDVERTEDLESDDHQLYSDLINEAMNWNSVEQFSAGVYRVYRETSVSWFDGENASIISNTGSQLSRSIISYWIGLQMLAEQLKMNSDDLDEHN